MNYRSRLYGVATVLTCLFLLLSFLIRMPAVQKLDLAVLIGIVSLRTEFATKFFRGVAVFGTTRFFLVGVPLLALAYFFRRRWKGSLAILFTILTAWGLMEGLKNFFQRPRPNLFPLEEAAGFSFPSGHAWMDTVFFGLLAVWLLEECIDRFRPVVLSGTAFFLALVGLSRLYLGVHYPTDVLAGYAGGLTILTLFLTWWQKGISRFSTHRL